MPDRHIKLLMNVRNQAIRFPREFELAGDDAIMRKNGNKMIIESTPPRSLVALMVTLKPRSEAITSIHDEIPDEVEI